jgi:hypothetical protein
MSDSSQEERLIPERLRRGLKEGLAFTAPAIELGRPLIDETILADTPVRVPLRMLNRHGLISGATGTGKTRTLQMMTDALSAAGIPVFLADVKGDLSGLSVPGAVTPSLADRMRTLGAEWSPAANPVEFLSLGGAHGAPARTTPHSFGPLLLARALRLNETQESVLSLVFRWCDDRDLLVLDLKDLRAVLAHLRENAGSCAPEYGEIAPATVNVILRKILDLEDAGGNELFGEPEFDVRDLLRIAPPAAGEGAGIGHVADARGIVTVLNVRDLQNRPRLFATFMMGLLSEIYETLPEVGDPEKPRLVFFVDEAHLLFDEASPEFLERTQRIIRLIRSKGVGVFFVTQNPSDIPDAILGQLGTRVQHALRAYTPKDRKAIKAMAENFPSSEIWDVETMMTETGTGEALVSIVGPTGAPLPTVVARMAAPRSRMEPLSETELRARAESGALWEKYQLAIDRASAAEQLGKTARAAAPPALTGDEPREAATSGPVPESPQDLAAAWQRPRSAEDAAIEAEARRLAGVDEMPDIAPPPIEPFPGAATSTPREPSAGPAAAETASPATTLYDRLLDSALNTVPAGRRALNRGQRGRSITDDVLRTASHEITRQIVRGLFGTFRRR